ncbi:hypothetical protein SAMN05421638_1289 [Kaistella treverensis]|uniref:Tetratricopeptide repeat protein n=1 Tax=Kaistella treverensis TaxID=631455 RepID=A0A1I3LR54_9FLAO|nr:hypothetical protein [Kaistella treverensis]SFI87228.1 hypothetical protein SAMN05421638_1289 [Kaistella treverensis]
MNGRILEIARNPELIQLTDLDLLKKEISTHPYLQSLRALHLLGTHRLNPENYSNELSITAAYTTDKKILYQLINSKKEESLDSELHSVEENEISVENPHEKYTAVASKEVEPLAKVYVNGELNRILFPGEEDFLTRENPHIDLEATLEAGKVVMFEEEETSEPVSNLENEVPVEEIETEKIPDLKAENFESLDLASNSETKTISEITEKTAEKPDIFETEQEPEFKSLDAENFTKEKIIHEEDISQQKEEIKDAEKLSYHGLDEFLPDVKIEASQPKTLITEAPKPARNKHEEEMQKLIAEVEAKMKASKRRKTEEAEEVSQNTDLNYSETQSFEVSAEKISDEENENSEKNTDLTPKNSTAEDEKQIAEVNFSETQSFEVSAEKTSEDEFRNSEKNTDLAPKNSITETLEKAPETPLDWKPMSFSNNTPDALIKKRFAQNIPVAEEKVEVKAESAQQETEEIIKVSDEKPEVEIKIEETKAEIESEENTGEKLVESNVPSFINTWQSWLKIERSDLKPEKNDISITEIKNKVIENFIEKEPKISKLKEESDFVIKERTDDISHLMTETLANLYVEQKLYAKAIKAYFVLTEKHPDKTAYFEEKINEIKTLRQK